MEEENGDFNFTESKTFAHQNLFIKKMSRVGWVWLMVEHLPWARAQHCKNEKENKDKLSRQAANWIKDSNTYI